MSDCLRRFTSRVGDTVRLLRALVRYKSLPSILFAPPGHFYSPLPDLSPGARRRVMPCGSARELKGVELRADSQKELLEQFGSLCSAFDFPEHPTHGRRFYSRNEFLGMGDALVLFAILLNFRPSRVVEVGSGFSSALMLDTNDRFLGGTTHFTFIEPYPDRLLRLLSEGDESDHEIISSPVQEVSVDRFRQLEAGDFLFIDSSHVAKSGSDVLYLLFEVLPCLNAGVIVHFHDVFWPFEYPEDWLAEGRAWNEAYFLRAFLQFNDAFEVLYFNSFMATSHREEVERHLPRCLENPGGSLWLRRKVEATRHPTAERGGVI